MQPAETVKCRDNDIVFCLIRLMNTNGLPKAEAQKILRETQRPGISTTPYVSCPCGTLLDAKTSYRKWYSGYVNYTEFLCGDCRKDMHQLPRVVCVACKSLMGFITPNKDKVTGFVTEKNRHYHISKCPKCDPKVTATPIIEHDRWAAARGIKTKTNHDLLQEIGQKRLQGVKDYEKLRDQITLT